jgi:hypothetical protein
MTKQKVFDTVKQVLTEKPETRDNDMYLTAVIWYRDLRQRPNVGDLSLVGFFHIMRDYKTWGLWSYETIARARRLVQETCVELRGEEYEKRHRKQQEVKDDIKATKAEALFGPTTTYTPQETYGKNDFDKPNEELLGGKQMTLGFSHE